MDNLENLDALKVGFAKTLQKQNFNITISLPIDNNANIKTVLNILPFLTEQKVECFSGKATITGKLGVKVLYIDTDNIYNTITDSSAFSQTILDDAITADCFLNTADCAIVSNVLSKEGSLKINCNISISPVAYLNLPLPQNNTFENMIVKKTEISTNTIAGFANTSFDYTTNFETKNQVSKILCHNAQFVPSQISAFDGYAVVEGKIFSHLVYETLKEEEAQINELTDSFAVKTEVKIDGLDKDCVLDLSFALDPSKETVATEFEDANSVITITNCVRVCGAVIKPLALDVVDDAYSTDNELTLTRTSREILQACDCKKIEDIVSGELTLQEEEPAIDQIVCNLGIQPEITNTYVKDGTIFAEGIVSSQVVYLDENKNCVNKFCELPFVINTKLEAENLNCVHACASVADCRAKAKRGTIIELEYTLNLTIEIYTKQNCQVIDNINIGKPLNFGVYDYQIYLAKPNETMWELCKRIKIAPEDLAKYNANLPPVMDGSEKVIIKR